MSLLHGAETACACCKLPPEAHSCAPCVRMCIVVELCLKAIICGCQAALQLMQDSFMAAKFEQCSSLKILKRTVSALQRGQHVHCPHGHCSGSASVHFCIHLEQPDSCVHWQHPRWRCLCGPPLRSCLWHVWIQSLGCSHLTVPAPPPANLSRPEAVSSAWLGNQDNWQSWTSGLEF